MVFNCTHLKKIIGLSPAQSISGREEGSEEERWEKTGEEKERGGYDCMHAGRLSCRCRGSEGTQSLFSRWRWAWGQKSPWFKSQLQERRKWHKMPQVLHWGWKKGTEHGFPSPLVSSDIPQFNAHSRKEGKSVLRSLQIQMPISFRNAFSDIPRKTFSTGHIVNHWSWHIIFFLLLKMGFFSYSIAWLWLPIPLLLQVSRHFPFHLDPLPFCLSFESKQAFEG